MAMRISVKDMPQKSPFFSGTTASVALALGVPGAEVDAVAGAGVVVCKLKGGGNCELYASITAQETIFVFKMFKYGG